MARSRKDAMAETRKALIAAGIAAFAAEGLDASLDGICARAGYTRGAFYVHFRDRDDFLVAVMDQVGVAYLDALFAAGDLPATAARFVRSVASGAYPLTRAGGVRPHQLLEACARSPAVRARYVALIEVGLARLAAIIRDDPGGVRCDVAADELAALLMAAVIGAHTLLDLEVPLDLGRLAPALLRLLAPPAPRPVRPRGRAHPASRRR